MNVFEVIYRWFLGLFGENMADFLAGFDCSAEDYVLTNQFLMYGFMAMGVALAMVFIYYYVINHPRFNKLWHWLVMLGVVGLVNLFIGAGMTLGDLNAGNIGDCLMNGENGGIYDSDCWMFGLANFFVSAMFFIVFSIGLKWWSTNCKRTPF